MKYCTILLSAMLTFSCVPQQKETPALAQQPKLQKQVPATTKILLTPKKTLALMSKKAEEPAQSFSGHYAGWLDPTPETSGYGVISLIAINEKTQILSFSTLFFGTRKEYKVPYQMNEKRLEVNTKTFNFSLDHEVLSIDLFNGVVHHESRTVQKLSPFEYAAKGEIFDRPIRTGSQLEYLSENFEDFKNASAVLLEAKDVENLRAIDLEVMKHSIYARHGAAFEDRRMTDFFSENDWYTPIFTMDEVREKLSEIEVKNIALINRFEKHAKRYYEEFGR